MLSVFILFLFGTRVVVYLQYSNSMHVLYVIQSKKVKFTIPDGAKEKSSSARKFKQLSKVSRNQALLSMYSSTEQCQSSPEISQVMLVGANCSCN